MSISTIATSIFYHQTKRKLYLYHLERCFITTTSINLDKANRNTNKARADPFARRPNKKCDPYGQGGKPLSVRDAERLLTTVDRRWILQKSKLSKTGNNNNNNSDDGDDDEVDKEMHATSLTREFLHPSFMEGTSFLQHIAAVAQMNDHFPVLHLERRLLSRQKSWNVVSSVTCNTKVLEGLSHHDFFLATLIDVECQRPEVNSLLLIDDNDTNTTK